MGDTTITGYELCTLNENGEAIATLTFGDESEALDRAHELLIDDPSLWLSLVQLTSDGHADTYIPSLRLDGGRVVAA